MNIWVSAAVAAATGTLMVSGSSSAAAPPGPSESAAVIAAAYGRNDALQAYTFALNIDMAMRTFPWLHFKMEGVGDYRRGDHYVVHITKEPSFASKMHQIDLSMIDPTMWPSHYRYWQVGEKNGDTVFLLEGLKKQSILKSATVALSPITGAHWVDATYTDGMHVHMNITSNQIFGFLLPTQLNADVNYPHMFPLSADASFSNYNITEPAPVPASPPAAPSDSPSPPAE